MTQLAKITILPRGPLQHILRHCHSWLARQYVIYLSTGRRAASSRIAGVTVFCHWHFIHCYSGRQENVPNWLWNCWLGRKAVRKASTETKTQESLNQLINIIVVAYRIGEQKGLWWDCAVTRVFAAHKRKLRKKRIKKTVYSSRIDARTLEIRFLHWGKTSLIVPKYMEESIAHRDHTFFSFLFQTVQHESQVIHEYIKFTESLR